MVIIGKKDVRFPNNLVVKALLTLNNIEIQDMAKRVGQSREWVTKVLNGHTGGKKTIEKIKHELTKHEDLNKNKS